MICTDGNPKLEAEGWQRRFLADPRQAEEAKAMYTAMGYEVSLEPLQPEQFSTACAACAPHMCRSYVLIYTRLGGEP